MFLPNSIATGMPYLPAKDELVSLNRLSSRGLWKRYNSNVFDRRLYGVGQHFTFCRFSRKRKFFGNFDCDFRKSFTKGFSSDWKWRISKFLFWRQILVIYRQPLLSTWTGCFEFIQFLQIKSDIIKNCWKKNLKKYILNSSKKKKIIKKLINGRCPYGLTYIDVDIMRPGYEPVSTKS